jgi:threonine dehydrogenase-like Zn-dependent dehydrogenase
MLTEKGGALFGYTDLYGGYDGGQAEFVRVPYADIGPRLVPEGLTDEQVLFCTDIFPTGWSGIEWAGVKGGETVAIFGAGPVGLMAAKSAWLNGAARVIVVDTQQYRLDKARQTAKAETVLWEDAKQVVQQLRDMTQGRGPHVCVECVGFEPERSLLDRVKAVVNFEKGSVKVLEACMSAVQRGGVVTCLGVYPAYYDNFPVGQWFDKGITLKGGQSMAHERIDMLLKLVADGKVVLDDIITHRLPLTEAAHGYDIFRNKEDGCVKVVLKP